MSKDVRYVLNHQCHGRPHLFLSEFLLGFPLLYNQLLREINIICQK